MPGEAPSAGSRPPSACDCVTAAMMPYFVGPSPLLSLIPISRPALLPVPPSATGSGSPCGPRGAQPCLDGPDYLDRSDFYLVRFTFCPVSSGLCDPNER